MQFYPQIRAVHVGAVLCSGTLFALRGVGVLASPALEADGRLSLTDPGA